MQQGHSVHAIQVTVLACVPQVLVNLSQPAQACRQEVGLLHHLTIYKQYNCLLPMGHGSGTSLLDKCQEDLFDFSAQDASLI